MSSKRFLPPFSPFFSLFLWTFLSNCYMNGSNRRGRRSLYIIEHKSSLDKNWGPSHYKEDFLVTYCGRRLEVRYRSSHRMFVCVTQKSRERFLNDFYSILVLGRDKSKERDSSIQVRNRRHSNKKVKEKLLLFFVKEGQINRNRVNRFSFL